jgi:hypothetical protein
MSRALTAIDRVVVALLGLLLAAAGAVGILWWMGRLSRLPDRTDLHGLRPLAHQPWWPWALGAAGVVLALLGLRWLSAHVPSRGVSHLNLPGSDETGKLLVSAGPVVSAAAAELGQTVGVRTAHGSIQRDRGQLVATLRATIERDTNLQVVTDAADRVSAHLQQALERDDLTCSVQLRTAGSRRDLPRVR